MTFEEIQQRLAAKFGERIGALAPANKDAFLVVQAADIVEICRYLKDDPDLTQVATSPPWTVYEVVWVTGSGSNE